MQSLQKFCKDVNPSDNIVQTTSEKIAFIDDINCQNIFITRSKRLKVIDDTLIEIKKILKDNVGINESKIINKIIGEGWYLSFQIALEMKLAFSTTILQDFLKQEYSKDKLQLFIEDIEKLQYLSLPEILLQIPFHSRMELIKQIGHEMALPLR